MAYLSPILQIRLLVGFLGERAQNAWWPTTFYELSSRQFLEPVLTRTSQLARYHGVLEAARRLHDEHLNVGVYHLFRLPEEVEQDLHSHMQQVEVDEFIRSEMHSNQRAKDSLQDKACSITLTSVGPRAVGTIKDLATGNIESVLAAEYISAFNRNVRVYPYLVA